MAAGQIKEDASRSALLKRYAHLKKTACEECGASESLQLHHEDRNWRNNKPSNLRTLCTGCHMRHHHAHGDITTKKPKPPCKACGKPSYRASEALCNTCRTRKRRGTLAPDESKNCDTAGMASCPSPRPSHGCDCMRCWLTTQRAMLSDLLTIDPPAQAQLL